MRFEGYLLQPTETEVIVFVRSMSETFRGRTPSKFVCFEGWLRQRAYEDDEANERRGNPSFCVLKVLKIIKVDLRLSYEFLGYLHNN